MVQYDIILHVNYLAGRYKSEHTYRFEDVQIGGDVEVGDCIPLPEDVRGLGFDKPVKVREVFLQEDQTDLLVDVETYSTQSILHSKLEELCDRCERYESD